MFHQLLWCCLVPMLAASPQHRFNPLLARHALRREGGQQKRQTGYSAPPPQQQTAASAPAGYGAPAPTCTTVYEEECKQVNIQSCRSE